MFYKRRNGNLWSYCKQCAKAQRARYYKKNKESLNRKSKVYYENNKESIKESLKRYRDTNRDAIARLQQLRNYGIDSDSICKIFQKDKCCFICGVSRSVHGIDLSIDHCHITGMIRGLLCHSCNTALGLFRDSAELLTNAINYLKTPSNESKQLEELRWKIKSNRYKEKCGGFQTAKGSESA